MTEKEGKPKVCPFLSIADKKGDEFTRCIEGECVFYLEKLPKSVEKCIWVRLAITLGNIWASMERPRGTTIMQHSLKRRMESLKRQHRPIS